MFLVTTALTEFWDTSDRMVFLGEWCKLYKESHKWEHLSYEDAPFFANDIVKITNKNCYLGFEFIKEY